MVENISESGLPSVVLDGYLQVLRYFDRCREDIRYLYTFSEKTMLSAISVDQEYVENYVKLFPAGQSARLPHLVGIPVRMGDILQKPHKGHGHTPASEGYLLRAALHMQMHHSPIIFMVLSNDIQYCRGIFKGDNFFFVELSARRCGYGDFDVYGLLGP